MNKKKQSAEYNGTIISASEITDYVFDPDSLGRLCSVRHDRKRLEFRIDPSERETLTTRIDELIDAIADIHRLRRDVFRRKTLRDADLLFAQQLTWFLLHTRWGLPHSVIASYFEHHRTTIMHGCQNCRDAYQSDLGFARFVDLLPFYANIDIDGGRPVALQALYTPRGSKDAPEQVKTPPRAREGAKTGIVGEVE